MPTITRPMPMITRDYSPNAYVTHPMPTITRRMPNDYTPNAYIFQCLYFSLKTPTPHNGLTREIGANAYDYTRSFRAPITVAAMEKFERLNHGITVATVSLHAITRENGFHDFFNIFYRISIFSMFFYWISVNHMHSRVIIGIGRVIVGIRRVIVGIGCVT